MCGGNGASTDPKGATMLDMYDFIYIYGNYDEEDIEEMDLEELEWEYERYLDRLYDYEGEY